MPPKNAVTLEVNDETLSALSENFDLQLRLVPKARPQGRATPLLAAPASSTAAPPEPDGGRAGEDAWSLVDGEADMGSEPGPSLEELLQLPPAPVER